MYVSEFSAGSRSFNVVETQRMEQKLIDEMPKHPCSSHLVTDNVAKKPFFVSLVQV